MFLDNELNVVQSAGMSIPTEDIIREISGMNRDMRENVRSFELSADDFSFNFGAVRRFDGKCLC